MRIAWADSSKGMAMILIVIGHTIDGILNAGIGARTGAWESTYTFLYTFHVPVFFIITGMFTGDSFDRHGVRAFSTSRLRTIVYPYFIWQTLTILLMLVSGASNNKPTWRTLVATPVLPYMQFWFIYALILVLAVYVASRSLKFRPEGILILAIAFYGIYLIRPLPWNPAGDFQRHFIYFAFGLVAANFTKEHLSRLGTRHAALLGLLLLGAAFFADHAGYGYHTAWRPLPALAGSYGVFLVCVALAGGWAEKALSFIGNYSLEIYCAHVIFSAGARHVLTTWLGISQFWPHVLVGITAGIAAPLALAFLDRRLGLQIFRFTPGSARPAPP